MPPALKARFKLRKPFHFIRFLYGAGTGVYVAPPTILDAAKGGSRAVNAEYELPGALASGLFPWPNVSSKMQPRNQST